MSKYFIGLMTGTSADSLDGCLVSFEPKLQIHQTITIPFSQTYKNEENSVIAGEEEADDSSEDWYGTEEE